MLCLKDNGLTLPLGEEDNFSPFVVGAFLVFYFTSLAKILAQVTRSSSTVIVSALKTEQITSDKNRVSSTLLVVLHTYEVENDGVFFSLSVDIGLNNGLRIYKELNT